MPDDVTLTAAFEELLEIELVDGLHRRDRRRSPALNELWERAHDHLMAAQQEAENRLRERH